MADYILKNMKRYCDQCGAEIGDESEMFCSKCGSALNEIAPVKNDSSHHKIIILLLAFIIGLLVLFIVFSSFGNIFAPKETPALDILTGSSMTTDEYFEVKLTGENGAISGEPVNVTFSNGKNSYEYSATTNGNGIAKVTPSVELGDYEVKCEFEGNDKYSSAAQSKSVTVKQAEPDYESYSYSRSFESTDINGDGYVTLSDMTIAHTPKNIRDQMYADSDDNGDGKLNRHEYYKFMYKLNYDKHSYGL